MAAHHGPRFGARCARTARGGLLGCALAMGCGEPSEPEPDMFVAETGGDSVVVPSFIDPASGMLTVDATRDSDVVLQVSDIDPARTDLVVDGLIVGQTGPGAPLANLGDAELRLRLRGAQVPGAHRLLLRTDLETDTLVSEEIVINVRPAEPPALTVTPLADTVSARMVAGFSSDLAVALDDTELERPSLAVAIERDGTWDWDDARTLTLPGLRLGPDELSLPVWAELTRNADGDPDRLRVVWRDGDPGQAIMLIDVPWVVADPDVVGMVALSLSADVTGPVEYAQWRRPFVLGGNVVAELLAATDVEMPRPGDRAVVHASIIDESPVTVGPARRLAFGTVADLDMLGPAYDPAHAEIGGGPLLSARLDQRRAVVVEFDDGLASLRPSRGDDEARTFVFTNTPLVTVAGGFGSSTVAAAAVQQDGRFRVLRNASLSSAEAEELTLTDAELPPLDRLRSTPGATLLGGAALFVLPFGAQTPVRAVFASDRGTTVVELPELSCQSIAVSVPAVGSAAPAVAVACAADGTVVNATITVEASG